MTSDSSTSVPLPARDDRVKENVRSAPVWSVNPADAAGPSSSLPTSATPKTTAALEQPFEKLCEAKTNPDMTCCRTLKDDKRTLVDPETVR